ncbi:MAG TPA: glutamyl-tRNA reductase [Candidatus Ozemobacteraceae bacterium]
MPLLLIGLNHRSAPVEVREQLARLCGVEIPDADGTTLEAVPVFTCNRVELYYDGSYEAAEESFLKLLADAGLPPGEFEPFLYRKPALDAIRHLFCVAGGLDSMVVGENQILHQLKTSYQHSTERGWVGKRLHALFQKAFEIGKRIRAETRISENTVSIASTAVDLAKRIFGPLDGCEALVVGAGEMASLTLVHLKSSGIGRLVCTNRTFEKAGELAARFDAVAKPFENLPELLAAADVVITSTGAQRPIISRAMLETAIRKRPNRPMFVIDIAVPRDIPADAGEIENLFLYDIDDLQNVVDEHLGQRRQEADRASAIVEQEAAGFRLVLESFTLVPLIRALREQAETLRRSELERFLAQHGELSPELRDAFEQFTSSMMAKWLHQPIVELKSRGAVDREQLRMIAAVFGLPEEALPQAPLYILPKAKDSS